MTNDANHSSTRCVPPIMCLYEMIVLWSRCLLFFLLSEHPVSLLLFFIFPFFFLFLFLFLFLFRFVFLLLPPSLLISSLRFLFLVFFWFSSFSVSFSSFSLFFCESAACDEICPYLTLRKCCACHEVCTLPFQSAAVLRLPQFKPSESLRAAVPLGNFPDRGEPVANPRGAPASRTCAEQR